MKEITDTGHGNDFLRHNSTFLSCFVIPLFGKVSMFATKVFPCHANDLSLLPFIESCSSWTVFAISGSR